jgi:transposase-like protein
MKPFNWTEASEKAVALVAEGLKTDEAIAKEIGIVRRTLHTWRQHPDFRDKVKAHLKAVEEAFLEIGIANKINRVHRKNQTRAELLQIVAERSRQAIEDKAEYDALVKGVLERGGDMNQVARISKQERWPYVAPGQETGHIVRTYKAVGKQLVEEYAVDTALLSQIDRLEMDTARELGQLVERQQIDANVRNADAAESLDRKLAGLFASAPAAGVSGEPDAGREG